ncbi:DUF3987 domain-containing protein [Calidifontimicrobium sp. SYSU G02091]|uniref:DUF3987 domain-containing protein n=1 Tax=Calidifontimicrobium sp. SYSU G02091 TaxID=2926421 RepID=UPI001F534028|nr:DUF3987 domain-containing protein [Calidifontimicrobium sp. SYSU G02091]MCI1191605.1 DUF3987 domain-containing protein [Calidifontimicrobium sp. SYSU G02091]
MSAVPNFTTAAQSRLDAAVWPELDPLPEPADEAPQPFPFDGLGPVLGPAARAVAELVQAPDALAAGSVLAAAAVAAQPHADVLMPHGQAAPLSLFVVISAESGDRKSRTDTLACLPIEERRRLDAREHARAMQAYRAERASRRPGDAESEPPPPRSVIVSKATVEGLHMLLRSQSAIGLFSPEGAEVIGGHSMREERRLAGIAWMLKAWGGETLDSLTRGDGLSVLMGRRTSVHLMVQAVVLRTLMADPLAQGQGLIARCLIAAPRTLAGTRLFRDTTMPGEVPAVAEYYDRLRALVNAPARLHPQGDGFELAPRHLPMTPRARALWIEFYNECERQQADGGTLAGVRPFASKVAEHAARIAGIIAIINDPDASAIEIEIDTMAGAIEVADFYLGEHVRLMGQSVERQRIERLRALVAWMRERGPFVPHRDVLQASPRQVRLLKAEGIGNLMDELQRRDYVRRDGDRWEARK